MHRSFDLPVAATGALVAGVAMFARSFRDLRTWQLMRDTPTARIRSMSMGLVEIDGQVVQRSATMAPFSGRPCAYWEVDVSTRARNRWSVVHRNASGHPFFLRDTTGLALIYPKGAECRINFGVEEECNGVSLPDCYGDYMNAQHLGVWRLGMLRFRERVLEEGQHLFVMGTAMPRARAYVVSEPDALQATGTDGGSARRVQTLDEEAVALVRCGENEKTFIISQQSERDLSTQLGFRAQAELVGGPALALFGLGYWLYSLAGRLH